VLKHRCLPRESSLVKGKLHSSGYFRAITGWVALAGIVEKALVRGFAGVTRVALPADSVEEF